ncbi:TetR/AcrR family transcriptional regulator [Acetobacterium sp.]|uniref:TetR/AcrR family transcriptional regulator n=1 Tax=Acetobacterium sp. TaxID=1872094 RepID=UPI0027182319|nr:TetR/AcrR family transcriptional regulator [Acetobacterium sp.]MDO9493643.1 TetR/AcrR family transcriptional regulator [Acetobacterium sp.]
MPPKIKIKEDAILDVALEITRKSGIKGLNAREIAKILDCSIQPIFRTFQNMDNLKTALYQKVEDYYNTYMLAGMNHRIPFLGMGLAYIRFASEEKNLFKLLFMSESIAVDNPMDMISGDDNQEVIELIAGMTGLNQEHSKKLFVDIWLLTHGIASLVATNHCQFSHQEIEAILMDAFKGYLDLFTKKEEEQS